MINIFFIVLDIELNLGCFSQIYLKHFDRNLQHVFMDSDDLLFTHLVKSKSRINHTYIYTFIKNQ